MEPSPRHCRACGNEILPGASFCNSCGARIDGRAVAARVLSWWQRQRDWARILLVLGTLLAIGLAVGLGLGLSQKTENLVSEQVAVTQMSKGQDAAAKSLVRNAMTVVESAYVDVRTFDQIPEAFLEEIEPSIDFIMAPSEQAALNPPAGEAEAMYHQVYYFGGSSTVYGVGTRSESGKTIAVKVDKGVGGGNVFYIDGIETQW